MPNITSQHRTDELLLMQADIGVSVTYRLPNSVVNLQTGTISESEETDSITAIISAVSQAMVMNSRGLYRVGDVIFEFSFADLPEYPPATTSQIIFEDQTYYIRHHDISQDGIRVFITASLTTYE